LTYRGCCYIICFILWILSSQTSAAQNDYNHFRFAFTADLGSHFQRAGVLFQYSHARKQFELTNAIEFKFALKGFGPQKKKGEIVFHLGSAFSHHAGNLESLNGAYLPFHLFRRNSNRFQYAYTFHYYLDQSSTSQGTGTISLKFGNCYLISENDLLGNLKGRDQYRTGALGIYLAEGNMSLGIKSILWTGQTRCAKMTKEKESNYPARFGYKNIKNCKYSSLSHGILNLEAAYIFEDYLMPSFSFGRDDERIRNVVQNKFIHDMRFIPKKLNTAENPHLPMIDTKGNPYLYKADQEIKKGNWLVQFGLNQAWFY